MGANAQNMYRVHIILRNHISNNVNKLKSAKTCRKWNSEKKSVKLNAFAQNTKYQRVTCFGCCCCCCCYSIMFFFSATVTDNMLCHLQNPFIIIRCFDRSISFLFAKKPTSPKKTKFIHIVYLCAARRIHLKSGMPKKKILSHFSFHLISLD